MMITLEADKLCIKRSGKEILRNVSFSVSDGEVYALLGGNGAGKSTTLLAFLGFLIPHQGTVRVNGVEVEFNLSAARRAIAYLPEAVSLYEHLDARENIQYFLELANSVKTKTEIESTFERVALADEARSKRLAEYSKGMRQKVAIALAILRDTDILLLDEPTSGLDPTAIDEFHDLVTALASAGKSILMVTHDIYGACQIAHRIGLLQKGELVGEYAAPAQGQIDTETVHKAFSVAKRV